MSVSNRMQSLMGNPSAIVVGHQTCATNPWSETNTQGYLNFGIAENHLIDDILLPKLNQPLNMTTNHIHYSGVFGMKEFKQNAGIFFEKYLGIKNINPDHIVIQSGVSSICEALSFALLDEGDYILIPTPYYTGFDHDFTKRFKAKFLKAHLRADDNLSHNALVFKETYENFPAKNKVKAILITHPHNPTGESLSLEFMQEIVQFAKIHNLHIISDEIYALSTHENTKHHSLFQMAQEQNVQASLLYGMAKDFAVAGLKVGFFYTNDEKLSEAMGSLTYFHPVSTATQLMVNHMLADHEFIDELMLNNSQRLTLAKNLILENANHLTFIPAKAGLFMVLDLSKWCNTPADEDRLSHILLHELKINFSKGADLGMNKPGYFRVCFARPEQQLLELCSRLKNLKRP